MAVKDDYSTISNDVIADIIEREGCVPIGAQVLPQVVLDGPSYNRERQREVEAWLADESRLGRYSVMYFFETIEFFFDNPDTAFEFKMRWV